MKRAVVVLAFLLAACGKRGDPRPPVPVIPQGTSDLVVAQRANRIVLSWTFPGLTTTGRTLGGFRRIVVYRYSEPLPPSSATAPAVPPEPAVPDVMAQFATVPTLTPVQFARLGERIYSIEGANLADATIGNRLTFTDSPALTSPDGRPVRLTYAVVTEGLTARSPLSNLATVVPLPVAMPPTGLTATAVAEGVRLTWEAPQAAVGGGKPVIAGYNLYRGSGETLGREFSTPVNKTPIEGTSYTDAPPVGEHEYRVSAVAAAGPPPLESDPSDVARVRFRDIVPPPAPAFVSALVETNAVRLVWAAVDVPDLAGYQVHRAEGTGLQTLREVGKIPLTALMSETHFRDPGVQIGISYRYEVTAIDKSGNVSEPVSTGWVLVPRTP